MAAPYSSTVNSADVDTIISQAIDLSALEQIAAHLSDSSLPIDLKTRFQKLKSFPGPTSVNRSKSRDEPMKPLVQDTNRGISKPDEINSPTEPDGMTTPDIIDTREGFSLSPSPLSSFRSPRESPSPPRQMCCFGCSTREVTKRKGKSKGRSDVEYVSRKWGESEEILTDFSTFSLKEQQRKLKKALKEEEKAGREVAKVVEWVKQASARMDVTAIDKVLVSEK